MSRRKDLQCLLKDRSSHVQNLCIVQLIGTHQDERLVTIRLVILTW